MADDSPTGGAPTNAPAPRPEPRSEPEPSERGTITCQACESVLHRSGDVKRKSESLKKLEKAMDSADDWKSKYEHVKAELDRLQAPAPAPAEEEPARFPFSVK